MLEVRIPHEEDAEMLVNNQVIIEKIVEDVPGNIKTCAVSSGLVSSSLVGSSLVGSILVSSRLVNGSLVGGSLVSIPGNMVGCTVRLHVMQRSSLLRPTCFEAEQRSWMRWRQNAS
jgi:hypothetical protein